MTKRPNSLELVVNGAGLVALRRLIERTREGGANVKLWEGESEALVVGDPAAVYAIRRKVERRATAEPPPPPDPYAGKPYTEVALINGPLVGDWASTNNWLIYQYRLRQPVTHAGREYAFIICSKRVASGCFTGLRVTNRWEADPHDTIRLVGDDYPEEVLKRFNALTGANLDRLDTTDDIRPIERRDPPIIRIK